MIPPIQVITALMHATVLGQRSDTAASSSDCHENVSIYVDLRPVICAVAILRITSPVNIVCMTESMLARLQPYSSRSFTCVPITAVRTLPIEVSS